MKPHESNKEPVKILRDQTNWEKLFFYKTKKPILLKTAVFGRE